jgi:hypothetical protein
MAFYWVLQAAVRIEEMARCELWDILKLCSTHSGMAFY